jgi:rare lipoprotein A
MAVGGARRNGGLAARNVALIALLAGTATACASTGTSLPVNGQHPSSLAQAAPRSGQPPSGRLRGTDKPYQVAGQWYFPQANPNYDEVGTASWYGYPFQARHTADGEIYDQELITAAHKTLPLPCIVEVTNLQNGRSIRVRVNDRGPFVGGRLIDLSKAAAEQLGFDRKGTTRVRVRFITMASPLTAPGLMMASNGASAPPSRPHPYAAQPGPSGDAFDDIETAPPPPAIPVSYQPPPVTQPSAYAPQPPAHEDPMAEDEAGPPEAPPPVARAITATALPPPAPAPTSTHAIPTLAGGSYSVQAGAFATQSSADRAAARLAPAGGAQIVPLQRNGATLYRVVVGSFPDPAAAGETRTRVIALGFSDARVVGAD